MVLRRATLIIGLVFLVLGVMGFIPALLSAPRMEDPVLIVDSFYGRLMGLFPVNSLHSAVHILLGLWAVAAFRDESKARFFNKGNTIIYGALALMGLFPVLNTTFGLLPLHSHDVWLHAAIALVTGYFGFVWEPGQAMTRTTTPSARGAF